MNPERFRNSTDGRLIRVGQGETAHSTETYRDRPAGKPAHC